jgi:hypothetical protein
VGPWLELWRTFLGRVATSKKFRELLPKKSPPTFELAANHSTRSVE